jgi:RNA polymerase sigma-70 factor, ECF subfamily
LRKQNQIGSQQRQEANMRLVEQSDVKLFEAMRGGNLRALDVLYDRYGDRVYRLAWRILQNNEEAADLTHDVFIYLWRNAKYDADRGSLIAFLTVMTRSRAINRLRQMRSQQRLAQNWGYNTLALMAGKRQSLEDLSLEETSQRVREALQDIPENQRQVLEMAYYDGLSQAEITDRLDVPIGTVKTWARRGLIRLRQILTDLVE